MGGTGEGLEPAQPPVVSARRKMASLALIALAMMSCDPVAEPEAAAIRLAPVVSSEAPLSVNAYVALATEATACVLNDYETQVHCIYRGGGQADVFGRPGGGPGEFQTRPRSVTRGPDGTVAVIGYNWVVLFEPSGRFVADVRVPLNIRLSASADSVLMGSQLEIDRPSRVINTRHLEVDLATGKVLWEGYFPTSIAAQADCPPRVSSFSGSTYPTLGNARRFPSGGIIFFALCRGQLLFLSHPDDESGIVMQPPLYTLEYPTRRDVERYLEGCELPASRILGLPCEVERFRRTPKHYGIHYWVDDQDRLWVLTDRDREEYSYLDVYTGPEFSGSVRVRHRAVGFDVLGSTLAVLVDRPVGPDDPDGIPDRGIDWYDIEGLEFGKLPGSER